MTTERKRLGNMKWKNYVAGVTLLSIVFIMTGCGNTGENTATSSIPIVTSTTTLPSAVGPLGERPSSPILDLAAAATKLGITEQQLHDALGSDTQKPSDLAAAASKLGVSEEALREALGFQGGMFPGGVNQTMPAMDLAVAATKLGITEKQLRDALGTDTQKPLDIGVAAKTLGITEEALREALGFQEYNPPPGSIPPKGALPTGVPPAVSP
jgi:hypothetical protein